MAEVGGGLVPSDGAGRIERAVGAEALQGAPIDYVPGQYLREDGWNLVPQGARDWAAGAAGAPITDPVTGVREAYWFSDLSAEPGPPGQAPGSFELFMFGRRGLAVCHGTTDRFVASPGGSAWRQERWQLPVDPQRIRNDHRRGATANTGASGRSDPSGTGAPPAIAQVIPEGLRADFGNLPVATQQFLVRPFVAERKRPQQVVLRAINRVGDGVMSESIWTYLFNASWVSFAFLQRRVPIRNVHLDLDALWDGSPEALDLAVRPWDVATWVSPVLRDPTASALPANRPAGELT